MPTSTTASDRGRSGVPLFATSIFAAAFLIFLVQPMVGKHILPWFGGVPGVWTLCLAFYQATLFLGYAYAHLLIRTVPTRRQLVVHGALLLAAFLVLPVLPDESWKPSGTEDPNWSILAMLAANVALPFFVLAATGPLLQAWFARRQPDRSPFFLYALSNAGSLLALLGFPFLVEPSMSMSLASRFWSSGFTLAGASVLACAWTARGEPRAPLPASEPVRRDVDPESTRSAAWLWLSLPGCAVVLLMGVTNKLCLDVASVPFLWVVPLSIYLSTFILCFHSEGLYRRWLHVALFAVSIALLSVAHDLTVGSGALLAPMGSVLAQILLYGVTLFAACMMMHGELYRLRPSPSSLTFFYLCVAAGGALGGLFVGIAAPKLWDRYFELPLALWLCCGFFLAAWWRSRRREGERGRLRLLWAAAGLFAAFGLVRMTSATLLVPDAVLLQERNFFGVLRVFEVDEEDPSRHRVALSNGAIQHGTQFQDPKLRRLPTAYFGRMTGIAFALESRAADPPLSVGIIGLGIGTLAAYGRPGDLYRFYEINPSVVRIARDDGLFSYLGDSRARIEVVEGDARLALESELLHGGSQRFDVLVVDAFNSDSIPTHLLTEEAFQLYARHLGEGGILAVHVTNAHLRLTPLVFRLAERAGLDGVAIANRRLRRSASLPSEWVILCSDPASIRRVVGRAKHREKQIDVGRPWVRIVRPDRDLVSKTPVWTDDYSDLLSLVK